MTDIKETKKFDESTFPPKLIEMVKDQLSKPGIDEVIINSYTHKRKLLFVCKNDQTPYCKQCWNSLVIKTMSGYINCLYIGYCNKCNLDWQVGYIEK